MAADELLYGRPECMGAARSVGVDSSDLFSVANTEKLIKLADKAKSDHVCWQASSTVSLHAIAAVEWQLPTGNDRKS